MAAAAGDDSLPPGWTRLVAPSGQVYYEDAVRHTTQLVHPLTEPLPEGWRMAKDKRGRPYYLNDADSTSHWDHPCKWPGQACGGDGGGGGGGAAAAAPSVPPAWEVMVDGGKWYPFPPETNHMVALAAAKGVTRVSIGSARVVDLVAMEQLRTGGLSAVVSSSSLLAAHQKYKETCCVICALPRQLMIDAHHVTPTPHSHLHAHRHRQNSQDSSDCRR